MSLQVNDSVNITGNLNVNGSANLNDFNLNNGNSIASNTGTINLNGNMHVTGNAIVQGSVSMGTGTDIVNLGWNGAGGNSFTIRTRGSVYSIANPTIYVAKLWIGSNYPGDYWYGFISHHNASVSITGTATPIWAYNNITPSITNIVYAGFSDFYDVTWTFNGNYSYGIVGGGGFWGSVWYRPFM